MSNYGGLCLTDLFLSCTFATREESQLGNDVIDLDILQMFV